MATTIAATTAIAINTKACTFVGPGNRTLILAVSLASVVVLRWLSVAGNCGCAVISELIRATSLRPSIYLPSLSLRDTEVSCALVITILYNYIKGTTFSTLSPVREISHANSPNPCPLCCPFCSMAILVPLVSGAWQPMRSLAWFF